MLIWTGMNRHYKSRLRSSFGRLGNGCHGPQEIRFLNRVVSVESNGLTYEADLRHCDLLMSSLNLNSSNSLATPGVNPHDWDGLAIEENEPETPLPDYSDPDGAIAAIYAPSMLDQSAVHRPINQFAITNRAAASRVDYTRDKPTLVQTRRRHQSTIRSRQTKRRQTKMIALHSKCHKQNKHMIAHNSHNIMMLIAQSSPPLRLLKTHHCQFLGLVP